MGPLLCEFVWTNSFLAYFEEVNPIYPLLDRASFEQGALRGVSEDLIQSDPTWYALYYAVLALGCLSHEGTSYVPSKGSPWAFYRMALSLLPKALAERRSLRTAQVSRPDGVNLSRPE